MQHRHRVVIIGAGFGGLAAARALRDSPVDIDLIDANNFHLFQPLLYQVATAGLDAGDVAYAVRGVFRRQPNVSVQMARHPRRPRRQAGAHSARRRGSGRRLV